MIVAAPPRQHTEPLILAGFYNDEIGELELVEEEETFTFITPHSNKNTELTDLVKAYLQKQSGWRKGRHEV
jgi:hypothetical protein